MNKGIRRPKSARNYLSSNNISKKKSLGINKKRGVSSLLNRKSKKKTLSPLLATKKKTPEIKISEEFENQLCQDVESCTKELIVATDMKLEMLGPIQSMSQQFNTILKSTFLKAYKIMKAILGMMTVLLPGGEFILSKANQLYSKVKGIGIAVSKFTKKAYQWGKEKTLYLLEKLKKIIINNKKISLAISTIMVVMSFLFMCKQHENNFYDDSKKINIFTTLFTNYFPTQLPIIGIILEPFRQIVSLLLRQSDQVLTFLRNNLIKLCQSINPKKVERINSVDKLIDSFNIILENVNNILDGLKENKFYNLGKITKILENLSQNFKEFKNNPALYDSIRVEGKETINEILTKCTTILGKITVNTYIVFPDLIQELYKLQNIYESFKNVKNIGNLLTLEELKKVVKELNKLKKSYDENEKRLSELAMLALEKIEKNKNMSTDEGRINYQLTTRRIIPIRYKNKAFNEEIANPIEKMKEKLKQEKSVSLKNILDNGEIYQPLGNWEKDTDIIRLDGMKDSGLHECPYSYVYVSFKYNEELVITIRINGINTSYKYDNSPYDDDNLMPEDYYEKFQTEDWWHGYWEQKKKDNSFDDDPNVSLLKKRCLGDDPQSEIKYFPLKDPKGYLEEVLLNNKLNGNSRKRYNNNAELIYTALKVNKSVKYRLYISTIEEIESILVALTANYDILTQLKHYEQFEIE